MAPGLTGPSQYMQIQDDVLHPESLRSTDGPMTSHPDAPLNPDPLTLPSPPSEQRFRGPPLLEVLHLSSLGWKGMVEPQPCADPPCGARDWG